MHTSERGSEEKPAPVLGPWRKLLIAAVVSIVLYFLVFGPPEFLTLAGLRRGYVGLRASADAHPARAVVAYIAVYWVVVGLSVPGMTALSLAAGVLFPQPLASIGVVVGATGGSVLLHVLANSVAGDFLTARVLRSGRLGRIGALLRDDEGAGPVTLMLLRMVPVFPFWFVNLSCAVLGVPLWTFAWTTAVAIIPGSYLYTEAGAALLESLEAGGADAEDLSVLWLLWRAAMRPNVRYSIAILAVWIGALGGYRWWRARGKAAAKPLFGTDEEMSKAHVL